LCFRNSAPNAGQESGAAVAVADDQSVDIGTQGTRKLSLALAGDMPRRRQNGYMEIDLFHLRWRQRRKTRIVERRFAGIVHHIVHQRTMRDKRAPATAQAIPDLDRDEARTLRAQRRRYGAFKFHVQRRAGMMSAVANCVTHEVEQQFARRDIKLCRVGILERKRAISDHSLAESLRVAGVAHIEGRDPQIPPLRLIEQTVNCETPAGAVAVATGRLQALDRDGRLGILCLARRVVVEMAEIGGDDDRRFRPAPQRLERL
jgi:hypothetical protein